MGIPIYTKTCKYLHRDNCVPHYTTNSSSVNTPPIKHVCVILQNTLDWEIQQQIQTTQDMHKYAEWDQVVSWCIRISVCLDYGIANKIYNLYGSMLQLCAQLGFVYIRLGLVKHPAIGLYYFKIQVQVHNIMYLGIGRRKPIFDLDKEDSPWSSCTMWDDRGQNLSALHVLWMLGLTQAL